MQFKATMLQVIGEDELHSLITGHTYLDEFYRRTSPPITPHRIAVEQGPGKLREQAATRLYRIRCRVVHSKEEEGRPLLPGSAEEVDLRCDTTLLGHIAALVLRRLARPLASGA